jgi:NitT/TauT family transport system substrate-binding protein
MVRFIKSENAAGVIAALLCSIFLLSGCSDNNSGLPEKYMGDKSDTLNSTVKIAYYGRIDETPLFAAVENGFFKNNGINAKLVKMNDIDIKSEFNSGSLDAITADYRFFQYIEEGLPLKLTAGLHAGCIRVIVPLDSKIAAVKDLKEARIGVEAPGDGTMVLTSMLLKNNGIGPAESLDWKYYGGEGYIRAFENGDIDAACIWEPSEKDYQLLKAQYRTIYTNVEKSSSGNSGNTSGGHNHGAGLHFTRTFSGLSANLVEGNPEKAIFITKAWLEGAQWVSENSKEAVRLAVDKQYVTGSYEENLNRFSAYMWTNGVRTAKPNIKYFIKEQKANGLLKSSLNENEFFKKVFAGILPEFY